MALKDLIAGLKPAKEAKEPKNQRKYVQFTLEEWGAMEKSNGGTLETSDVKALVVGIFAGAVNITIPKAPAK